MSTQQNTSKLQMAINVRYGLQLKPPNVKAKGTNLKILTES